MKEAGTATRMKTVAFYLIRIVLLITFVSGCATTMPKGATDLMEAAQRGELDNVRVLIGQGRAIDAKDVNGHTALFYAAEQGRTDIVRALIEKGADVNARDYIYNASPIFYAVGNDSTDIVRALIEKGADVNARASKRSNLTPLLVAAFKSNLQIVQVLVEAGADVNARCDARRSITVTVHKTVHTGEVSSTATGTGVEFPDGHSALSFAIMAKNLEMVKYLVKKGADVRAQVVYKDAEVVVLQNKPPLELSASDFRSQKEEVATILELAGRSGNPTILAVIQEKLKE